MSLARKIHDCTIIVAMVNDEIYVAYNWYTGTPLVNKTDVMKIILATMLTRLMHDCKLSMRYLKLSHPDFKDSTIFVR